LDERARDIFRRVVESYLDTGEPVGSRTLSKGGVHLSPASIRNTMQDLTQLGLLGAPHISAGRLPTHAGLRLFVDGLLEVGDLAEEERRDIDARLFARGSMPYSAVTQPWPRPRRKGGTLSSTLAVTKTRVWPNAIRQDPSA
jgi:transcriptional regulator of heat shock response